MTHFGALLDATTPDDLLRAEVLSAIEAPTWLFWGHDDRILPIDRHIRELGPGRLRRLIRS